MKECCEDCGGTGRVQDVNQWCVDKGTKWQRSFEEQVEVECPTCNGSGNIKDVMNA